MREGSVGMSGRVARPGGGVSLPTHLALKLAGAAEELLGFGGRDSIEVEGTLFAATGKETEEGLVRRFDSSRCRAHRATRIENCAETHRRRSQAPGAEAGFDIAGRARQSPRRRRLDHASAFCKTTLGVQHRASRGLDRSRVAPPLVRGGSRASRSGSQRRAPTSAGAG